MTLRVVPQKMDMQMTMLGVMYAPSDAVTLLAMVMQMDNAMVLQSYQGMMGETPRVFLYQQSAGTGDTIIGALFRGGETANGNGIVGLLCLCRPAQWIKPAVRWCRWAARRQLWISACPIRCNWARFL